ncbi:MAG TPA: hypothetical protein VK994_03505, partial [Bacteroidales bacterium]|nr:hypothetical protein [Bacteroidales bacterium]
MSNVVVKENHLTFGGVAYFRAHAEEVEIGCIGEKRKPLFKQNYLEVKDHLLIPEGKIIKATEAEIDFTNTSQKAFRLKAAAIIDGVPVSLGGDAVFNRLRAGELKLVKFSVTNNDLKDIANASPEELESLRFWNKKARLAHQVFIVVEAKLADEFTRNVNVGLGVGVNGLEAKLDGGFAASGSTIVSISK